MERNDHKLKEDSVCESGARLKRVTETEIDAYIFARRKLQKMTALGVLIIFAGVIAMILSFFFFPQPENPAFQKINEVIAITVLLLCTGVSISLFIISGFRFSKYKYMEEGVFIEPAVSVRLTDALEAAGRVSTMAVTAGTLFCIFGILIFLTLGAAFHDNQTSTIAGLCSLLFFAAAASVFFVVPGGRKRIYATLLGMNAYVPEHTGEGRIIRVTASVVWPLTVAVFVIWGFCYNAWSIAWVVFPVAGVCFGAFVSICETLVQSRTRNNEIQS